MPLDPYELLIELCETREQHTLPITMRKRLAEMWRRSVGKAILVGWYKDDEALEPDVGTPSILRAAERALHDHI